MPRPKTPQPDARISPMVILYIAAVALPVRYSIGPLQMTGLRTFLALAFIPLLVSYVKNLPTKGLSTDLSFMLFVCWAALAYSQTSPAHALENSGVLILELLGGFLIARRIIRSADQFRTTVRLILIVVLLSLPIAVAESLTGTPPLIATINAIPGLNSVAAITIEPRLGLERAQVLFAHPIHYGLFASTIAALVFVGTADKWPLWCRISGLGVSVTASFLALSSGAFLAVLLQLLDLA